MIFAGFAGSNLGRHPGGGGGHRGGGGGGGRGGFHLVRPGSYYPANPYPAPEYVAPPPCTTWPNPVPPCAGTLVWLDARTVCCK